MWDQICGQVPAYMSQDIISNLSSFRNVADGKVEATNASANSRLQPTIAQQKQMTL